MKKVLFITMLIFACVGCVVAEDKPAAAPAAAAGTKAAVSSPAAPPEMAGQGKEFIVYTDKNARGNHFFPSGWIGDFGDLPFAWVLIGIVARTPLLVGEDSDSGRNKGPVHGTTEKSPGHGTVRIILDDGSSARDRSVKAVGKAVDFEA